MEKTKTNITPLLDYALAIWLMASLAWGDEQEKEKILNSELYKSLVAKYGKRR